MGSVTAKLRPDSGPVSAEMIQLESCASMAEDHPSTIRRISELAQQLETQTVAIEEQTFFQRGGADGDCAQGTGERIVRRGRGRQRIAGFFGDNGQAC